MNTTYTLKMTTELIDILGNLYRINNEIRTARLIPTVKYGENAL
jgi:hypothetical protein